MQSILNSQRRLRCCLLGHAPKLGTGQIYNNLTKIHHISVPVGLIPTHVPAHTGKTHGPVGEGNLSWAHPRAYGERTVPWERVKLVVSSPPRIRGTPHAPASRAFLAGLTPAHTGERWVTSRYLPRRPSSPPRIRGTLHAPASKASLAELTPAYTGNALNHKA